MFRHGTRVIEDLALLDDFAHPPWTLRYLQGHVDAPFVNLTPGTRTGLVHDAAYATLCAGLDQLIGEATVDCYDNSERRGGVQVGAGSGCHVPCRTGLGEQVCRCRAP